MTKVKIDDEWFEEKIDGMILVDAYYIPVEDLEEYLNDRDYFARRATEIYESKGLTVSRDFQGSQDGEALIARDDRDLCVYMIHLDPSDIKGMKDAESNGNLEDFLLYED